MKITGYLMPLAASLALLSAPISAQDNVVNVYNWSDYIDEEILADFEAETGIKVNYDVFDSNELLETKLLAGGSGYDVVVPTTSFLARQIEAGVFQKLDKSKLPHIANMWPAIAKLTEPYDPGGAHAVNYMWGSTGIGYNVGKVTEILGEDAPLDSLALLFDPAYAEKLSECGIHLLDSPTETLPAALSYIGEDPTSLDPDVIKKAEATMLAIRPFVQKFHSSEYINALANGDICIALGWSGDMLQARDRAAEADNGVVVEYAIPSEGAQLWFDMLAIPADAPNPEAAHIFIDYMMRAYVAAKASNYVYYANGNLASQPLLLEDVIGDPAIYPAAETVANMYSLSAWPTKLTRVATRLWTKVKTGQ